MAPWTCNACVLPLYVNQVEVHKPYQLDCNFLVITNRQPVPLCIPDGKNSIYLYNLYSTF